MRDKMVMLGYIAKNMMPIATAPKTIAAMPSPKIIQSNRAMGPKRAL